MKITPFFAAAALILSLAACDPNVETRGYLKDPDWKDQLKVGESSRDDALRVLGSPSAKNSFGNEIWYYINTKRESFAFFRPEVTDEDVTRLTFDNTGLLTGIDQFDKSHARDIDISSRTTPTEGHQMTFMEQLLGNLGRFNSPATQPGQTHTRPGP
jgi:outer membrane protein assembly factor BamE (lipoprotein component of BamABCDE complex)